ncbi:MAG: hypothetical protein KDB22_27765 [Planctomycetales bacterium]|nr:hypothetical protein [Planctomycetales bacterium]
MSDEDSSAFPGRPLIDDNPYRAGAIQVEVATWPLARRRLLTALWWLVYLHPVIVHAGILACWLITAASLGRPPKFGEHPTDPILHRLVHVLGLPIGLLILSWPVFALGGWVLSFTFPFARQYQAGSAVGLRIVCLGIHLLLMYLSIVFWINDPFRAIWWFID